MSTANLLYITGLFGLFVQQAFCNCDCGPQMDHAPTCHAHTVVPSAPQHEPAETP